MIWVSQGLMPSNTKAAPRDSVNYIGSYGGLALPRPAAQQAGGPSQCGCRGDATGAQQSSPRDHGITPK